MCTHTPYECRHPYTLYLLQFAAEQRLQIQTEVMAETGRMWRELSNEAKQQYRALRVGEHKEPSGSSAAAKDEKDPDVSSASDSEKKISVYRDASLVIHQRYVERVHLVCPICPLPLERAVETSCGHLFCGHCLSQMMPTPEWFCPVCRAQHLQGMAYDLTALQRQVDDLRVRCLSSLACDWIGRRAELRKHTEHGTHMSRGSFACRIARCV